MKRAAVIGISVFLALSFPGVFLFAYDGGKDWKFTSSVTYESGDFGTGTDTDTLYTPFTLKRYLDKGDVYLTVPYIYQETGAGVTAIRGRPAQIRRATAGQATTSAEGLGDIVLGGSYYLLEEYEHPFSLSPVASIKFPTADEEEGLGTGEFDETVGLEASKWLHPQWNLFGGVYYTFIGDPPGTDLNDEFAFNVGVSYQISQPWTVSVSYEERTALLDGRSNPRDLFFQVQHKLTEVIILFGGFSIGLSDGSPDAGVTGGVSVKF